MSPRSVRRVLPLLAVLVLVGASLVRFTAAPLHGDDEYVLANLTSPEWTERLYAFNVDWPGPDGGEPWYEGYAPMQRRYVRLLPSGLMALEVALFGSRAVLLHAVSLAIHLANCLLGYALLVRWLGDRRQAALVVVLMGIHPVVREPISWFACQPLLLAGTFMLLAGHCLVRLERGARSVKTFGLVSTTFVAMTCYEAAVGLPLILIALDRWLTKPAERRMSGRATFALLALLPVYAVLVWANAAGVDASDAAYRAGLGEGLATMARDVSGYLEQSLLGASLSRAGFGDLVRTSLGAGLALALAAWILWRSAPTRLAFAGVSVYAMLLAPPVVARAFVSLLNLPSQRQLYLPHFGLAMVAAALVARFWSRKLVLGAAGLWLACTAYYLGHPPDAETVAQHARAGERVRSLVQGDTIPGPLFVIGESECGYHPLYDVRARGVWLLVPNTKSGRTPEVEALGSERLLVRAEDGFDFPTDERSNPYRRRPWRLPLLEMGKQELPFGEVLLRARDERGVTQLEIVFDRPLRELTFLRIRGCAEVDRLEF